jgi:molybdate transport repressor ModE-like protein
MPDNWQSVEIKHLRALHAVADTGTFWAAAEQLNSSLSTVSDHVGALEALVGQRLIERSRGRRTVSLTEAGRVLLGHAEAIAVARGRGGLSRLRIRPVRLSARRHLPERGQQGPAQGDAAL